MPEQDIDVKPDSTSSVESTSTSEVVQDETTPSSGEQQSPADLAKGFQDAVKKGFEAAQATESESTSSTEKKVEETKEIAKETEQKEADKGPIPYERFVEVNTAKQQLEQKIKEYEPYLEAQRSIADYCLQNNITNEDLGFWMQVAANVKNNPEKAMEMLQPHVQQLQAFKGDVLSPELQAAVDNGEMSLEWAKKLSAAENKQKFSQRTVELTKEQQQQQATQRYVQEVQTSFQNWAKTKALSDPDFRPKTSPEAEDGKFEFLLHKMNAEYQNAGIKDVQGLIAFAERVYESINKSMGRFAPQKSGTKNVRSTRSTSSVNGEPKTIEEAFILGAKKAGVNFQIAR